MRCDEVRKSELKNTQCRLHSCGGGISNSGINNGSSGDRPASPYPRGTVQAPSPAWRRAPRHALMAQGSPPRCRSERGRGRGRRTAHLARACGRRWPPEHHRSATSVLVGWHQAFESRHRGRACPRACARSCASHVAFWWRHCVRARRKGSGKHDLPGSHAQGRARHGFCAQGLRQTQGFPRS